jgi:hypothetical protein
MVFCSSAGPQSLAHEHRWHPAQKLTEFAVGWGVAEFEPRTAAPVSCATIEPLLHNFCRLSHVPATYISGLLF